MRRPGIISFAAKIGLSGLIYWKPNEATRQSNAVIRISIFTASIRKARVMGDILLLIKIIRCTVEGFRRIFVVLTGKRETKAGAKRRSRDISVEKD